VEGAEFLTSELGEKYQNYLKVKGVVTALHQSTRVGMSNELRWPKAKNVEVRWVEVKLAKLEKRATKWK
jgi:hypothetical protein